MHSVSPPSFFDFIKKTKSLLFFPSLAAFAALTILTATARADSSSLESVLSHSHLVAPAQKLNHSPSFVVPTGTLVPPGTLVAQAEGDDAYDPFADYSEFEESMDEEEEINFFRNGRLLTMGFTGGYRGWTQTLGQIYSGAAGFGLFMSYFFDLRFALQIGFMTSDHTLVVKGSGFDPIQGTVSTTDLSFLLKYYANTQNVTRGLADMNPYLVSGFSQIYRTINVSMNDNFAKDSAFAFNIGAGLEVPLMRNKMFFGVQANYQLVNFADEAKVILDKNDIITGVSPAGDSFLITGVLGINF
jgi:hypothetical protein